MRTEPKGGAGSTVTIRLEQLLHLTQLELDGAALSAEGKCNRVNPLTAAYILSVDSEQHVTTNQGFTRKLLRCADVHCFVVLQLWSLVLVGSKSVTYPVKPSSVMYGICLFGSRGWLVLCCACGVLSTPRIGQLGSQKARQSQAVCLWLHLGHSPEQQCNASLCFGTSPYCPTCPQYRQGSGSIWAYTAQQVHSAW